MLLVICPTLFAQENKDEIKKDVAKEPAKEQNKEPVKIAGKEAGKELIETKIYFDPEAKTKVKNLISYYKKNDVEIAHGPSKSFYESGQVKQEINFVEGLKEGIETFYSPKGLKEHELIWNKGELIKDIVYFTDGVIKAEVDLKTIDVKNPEEGKPDIKKQVKHGVEKLYFKNGRVYIQMQWADDEQNGLETKWYDNGKKKYELTWVKGKKEGIETQWFKDGKVSSITNWIDNKAHGEMINYHENGVKKDLLEWDRGVLVNERSSWNDKGELIAKCTNKNGSAFKGTVFDVERMMILTFEDGRQVSSKVCDKNGKLLE